MGLELGAVQGLDQVVLHPDVHLRPESLLGHLRLDLLRQGDGPGALTLHGIADLGQGLLEQRDAQLVALWWGRLPSIRCIAVQ